MTGTDAGPDTGAGDPRLAAAVAAWRSATSPGPELAAEVLAALPTARVFAAVTATSTAPHVEQASGLRAESSADMALVTLVSGGRRALPVFTSTAGLRSWRLDARPVPVPGDAVCAAALEQGADTLLVDLVVPVTGPELAALAAGYVPVVGSALAARRTSEVLAAPTTPPAAHLVAALARALAPERVRSARLLQGRGGPVLGVVPVRHLAPGELAELAARLVARLGSALPPEGLDLAVVPAQGEGWEVLPPGRWARVLRRGR